MRLRIPEAFNGRTPWDVARMSNGRLEPSTLWRLCKSGGKIAYVRTTTLQALCDVLGTTPGELIEYTRQPIRRVKRNGL